MTRAAVETTTMRVRSDFDILDGHVHCFQHERWPDLLRTLRYTGARQFALLDTGNDGGDPQRQQLQNALRAKREMPDDVFVFGGLDFTKIVNRNREPSGSAAGPIAGPIADDLRDQLHHLLDIGCDGLKLLTGKPDRRAVAALTPEV